MEIIFPPGRKIYIEIEGKKIASVEACKEIAKQVNRYIECIGEKEPVATAYGKISYSIELSKASICTDELSDNISFYDLYNFDIVIFMPDKKIVYSGCQWSEVTRNIEQGNTFLEKAVVNATERKESKI